MKRFLIAVALLCAPALSACGVATGISSGGSAAVTNVTGQVTLKATIALSLGELAFTSAEQAGTAALKSPTVPTAMKAVIADAVREARGYRDQARAAFAKGQDASALLTSLNSAILNINALTRKAK